MNKLMKFFVYILVLLVIANVVCIFLPTAVGFKLFNGFAAVFSAVVAYFTNLVRKDLL